MKKQNRYPYRITISLTDEMANELIMLVGKGKFESIAHAIRMLLYEGLHQKAK